jgi:hypothetical protein
MYDLGEEEPVASHRISLASAFSHPGRFGTPLDETLETYDIAIDRLADASHHVLSADDDDGVSRQTILAIRKGASPNVRVVARLVRTLRRCGYPVTASDIADVGEDR